MAIAAMTKFQEQIEAVRQEAFTAGYTTAMKQVKELTARAAPDAGEAAVPSRNGRGRDRSRTDTGEAEPNSLPAGRRHNPRTNGLTSGTRSTARRPQRGTYAVLVAEVLKSAAPRALRQAEIRRALQESGTTMSFPSIGYSLRQLAARNAARQVGNTKTWRHLAR